MKKKEVQAIRPNFFVGNLPPVVAQEAAKNTGASDEEQALYSLSQHRGWKIIVSNINDKIRVLKDTNREAMNNGLSFEVIGQNATVIATAEAIIEEAIFNKVNDAIEVCTTVPEEDGSGEE